MPFGSIREHTGAETSNYKFTDQELDSEIGLYNYVSRLYDPMIGRFITADTIVPYSFDPQLLNRYAYVRNNPLVYTDPTGHAYEGIDNAGRSSRDWGKEFSGGTGGSGRYDRDGVNGDREDSRDFFSIVREKGDRWNPKKDKPNNPLQKLVDWAKNQVHKTNWAKSKKIDQFSKGLDKCNKFVYNGLKAVGLPARKGVWNWPASAADWADPKENFIDGYGWKVTDEKPRPGDIISDGVHMGIVTDDKKSTYANPVKVKETNWGSYKGQKITVRRYDRLTVKRE